jgi:hypothetical protein
MQLLLKDTEEIVCLRCPTCGGKMSDAHQARNVSVGYPHYIQQDLYMCAAGHKYWRFVGAHYLQNYPAFQQVIDQ